MPEPEVSDDERSVSVVTAAGVEALREGAVVVDSERKSASQRGDCRANLLKLTLSKHGSSGRNQLRVVTSVRVRRTVNGRTRG